MGLLFAKPVAPITRKLAHGGVDFTFDVFDDLNQKLNDIDKKNEMSNLETKNNLLELNKKLDKLLSKIGKYIIQSKSELSMSTLNQQSL